MMRTSIRKRALTLLEVILSVAIISVLMTILMTFFWQSLKTREAVAKETERTQIARQFLERIADDLRGCVGVEELGFGDSRLIGTRRQITFVTTALPSKLLYEKRSEFDDPIPASLDMRVVQYELWADPNTLTESGDPTVGGILRREKTTLNQYDPNRATVVTGTVDEEAEGDEEAEEEPSDVIIDFGVDREEIQDDILKVRQYLWAPEMQYLEFLYYDGVEWTDTWEVAEGNPLPQLVQVTIGFDPVTMDEWDDADLTDFPLEDYTDIESRPAVKKGRYSILVRLPAADRFFGSRIQRMSEGLADQVVDEGMFE